MKLLYCLTTLLLFSAAQAEEGLSIDYNSEKRIFTYTYQGKQSPEYKKISLPVNGLISAVHNKSTSAASSSRRAKKLAKAGSAENLPSGTKAGVMNLKGETVLEFIYDYVILSKNHIITIESKPFGKSTRTLAIRDLQGKVKSSYPIDDHYLKDLQYPVFSFKTLNYYGLLNIDSGKVIRPQFISVGNSTKNIFAVFKDNCAFTLGLDLIPKHKGFVTSVPKDKHMNIVKYKDLSYYRGILWDKDGKIVHAANENEILTAEKKDKDGNPKIFSLKTKKPISYTFFTSEGEKINTGSATEADFGSFGFACKVADKWKAFDYSGKLLYTGSSQKLSVISPWLIQEEITKSRSGGYPLANLYDYSGVKISSSDKIKTLKDDFAYLESNKLIYKKQLLKNQGYLVNGKFIRDHKNSSLHTISGKLITDSYEKYTASENAVFILNKGAKSYKAYTSEGTEIQLKFPVPATARLNFIHGDYFLFSHDKKNTVLNPLKGWSLTGADLGLYKVKNTESHVLLKVEDELQILNLNCETVDTLKPVDKKLSFRGSVDFIHLGGDKKAIVYNGKFVDMDKYLGSLDGPQVFEKDGLKAYHLNGKMTPFKILHKYAEKSVYSHVKERFYTTVQQNDKIIIYNENLDPLGSQTLKLTGNVKHFMLHVNLRIHTLNNYSAIHY